jgi:hypothetical protein
MRPVVSVAQASVRVRAVDPRAVELGASRLMASVGVRDTGCLLEQLGSEIRRWALNRHEARW